MPQDDKQGHRLPGQPVGRSSDDTEAFTVDTRRGGRSRSKVSRDRPRRAENAEAIPVRQQPGPGRAQAGGHPLPGGAPRAPQYDEGLGGQDDRTRALPAGPRGPQWQGPGGPPYDPSGGGPRGPRPIGPGGGGPARRPRRRRRWTKWVGALLVIVLLWVAAIAWAGKTVWDKVAKVDAIPTSNRPAAGKGTNIVLVGSDSRAGLTNAEKNNLGTGSADGGRTDSIMLLHLPDSGDPTLVSLPRDSFVAIPGHNKNKINASFSIGGPQLLISTIELNTSLKVDGYMEIGFGGFASVVDSVGGVRMCLPKAMDDEKAHINLKAGCQVLDGRNALGYVRARYSDPLGDLGRAKRQREFLGALMKKMATPSNILNPLQLKKMGASGAQGVSVNNGMSPYGALKIMLALKKISGGSGQSVQVPVSDTNYHTYAGDAVLWNDQAARSLFDALNNDRSPNVQP